MRKFKLFFACLLMAVLSIGQMWGEDVTGTINFGSGSSCTNVNATSVSGDDSQGNTWTVTTAGTTSFTPNANYAQIGASKKPASSITFTTTLAEDQEITSFSAKFGGFSGTQGAVTLKVDDTTVGTGSLNATSDVTVENSSSETGKVLTVTVTGIAKGVKAYYISYTYSTGGGDTPPTPKTLESVSVSGTPTKTSYFAGQDFDPAGLTVTGHYSDDTNAEITSDITWSYDPAQELAENQTSINVKATVSDITSVEWYEVSGLTVAAGPDVFIDLVDAGWGLPTSYVVAETSYTKGDITIKLAGSTGNGFKVFTNSNIILGKEGAYLELPAFESPIERIVVAGNSGGSGKVTWNIFKDNAAVSTAVTGCKEDAYTFNIDPLEANVVYRVKVTNENNLQIKNIQIFFGEAPAVTKPSISGETPFLNSTNVSISIPEGTTVYYTTDGSDPKTAATLYSASFALNSSATVKAIATDGANWSEMVEKAFVKGTVLSVTEARAAIDAAPAGTENQFVKGIISQIDSYNSTYKSITYWISEDGTATNKLQVYSGLAGVVKEAFESTADLNVGDSVVVKGTIKKYNSTYEFDKNNTVAYRLPIARLAWSAESYAADIDNQQSNVYPTLMNTDNVAISYGSTDGSVATINGEGEISLVAVGTTTIKATFVGSDSYRWNYASYTLNVGSSLVHATISFDVDGGDAIEPLTDKQAVVLEELPVATKAGKNFGGWFKDQEKNDPVVAEALTGDITLYAKWLDPYTIAEAMAVIDAAPAGTANQYVAGIISQIDSYNNTYKSITYWISADGTKTNQLEVYGGLIGNAATALGKETFTTKEDLKLGDQVVVKGTLKKYNSTYEFDKDNIIYSFSRKAEAGLAWDEPSLDAYIGVTTTFLNLTNPHTLTVTYSSSDAAKAEIDETTGAITLKAVGTTTITATFAGNEDYKAAEVSYTLNVYEPIVSGTITYEENGGTEVADVTEPVDNFPDPLPTTTKENCLFDGWWSTSTFEDGTKAVAGAPMDGNVTLYAKWIEISEWAFVYSSNVKMVHTGSGTDNGTITISETAYKLVKAGASKATGTIKVTVPVGTTDLHFHAFAWSNQSSKIQIAGVENPSITEFDLAAESGASGSGNDFTLQGNPVDQYFHVSFDAVAEETEIVFSKADGSADNRFFFYGVNQVGGDFGSYQRGVTNGNYGTICLPKAGVMTGATLFEIADYANGMIYVDEVEGGVMEAGKPYIFQATSDQLNVAYTSNVEETAGENNGLHGFYNLTNENAQFDIPADAGNYILYQNQYWLVSGRAAYIANYRAYIKEQTATGINELNAAEAPVKMIMNGQLYILRGEKLYDATGRLVK